MTFCDTTAGNEVVFGHTYGRTNKQMERNGQKDVEVEIVKDIMFLV